MDGDHGTIPAIRYASIPDPVMQSDRRKSFPSPSLSFVSLATFRPFLLFRATGLKLRVYRKLRTGGAKGICNARDPVIEEMWKSCFD